MADWLTPASVYAPLFVRFGLGINFIFLGFHEKLIHSGRAALVVEQYDPTGVIPVSPELWIFGAGAVELALGIALLLGVFVRASAALAFFLFSMTLFALPNDPVLAHISFFGLVSALLITGSGSYALDPRLSSQPPDFEALTSGEPRRDAPE